MYSFLFFNIQMICCSCTVTKPGINNIKQAYYKPGAFGISTAPAQAPCTRHGYGGEHFPSKLRGCA